MRHLRYLVLASVGSLLLAGGARAAQTPTLHERTVQIPGMQCSVTAWDYYTTVNGVSTMKYGGGTSCAGHVGQRTLNVVPQVFNFVNGHPVWFNIGGAGLFQGPTPAGPLRLNGSRTAVPGRLYRLLAYGQVVLPNGRMGSVTVCADCQGTRPTLSITPAPGTIYTWPARAVQMPGLRCTVSVVQTRFPYINSTPVMQYGGELMCNTGVTGRKRLEIRVEVKGSGHGAPYHTVSGSQLSATTTTPFLALNTGRTVYIGHPYRVVAVGTIARQGKTTTATVHSLTAGP